MEYIKALTGQATYGYIFKSFAISSSHSFKNFSFLPSTTEKMLLLKCLIPVSLSLFRYVNCWLVKNMEYQFYGNTTDIESIIDLKIIINNTSQDNIY